MQFSATESCSACSTIGTYFAQLIVVNQFLLKFVALFVGVYRPFQLNIGPPGAILPLVENHCTRVFEGQNYSFLDQAYYLRENNSFLGGRFPSTSTSFLAFGNKRACFCLLLNDPKYRLLTSSY